MKEALEELDVTIDRRKKNPVFEGKVICALYTPDPPSCVLYYRQHKSFDELVLSLLHEACHHITDSKEYIINENLDRVAFSSFALRWAAAKKIGNAVLKFDS